MVMKLEDDMQLFKVKKRVYFGKSFETEICPITVTYHIFPIETSKHIQPL